MQNPLYNESLAAQAGRHVKRLRLLKRWSQAELARRADTSQTAVARLEAGHANPSVATLERVLHELGHRARLNIF